MKINYVGKHPKNTVETFFSPHFKLWYGYEMYYVPDSITQNDKKKIIQRSVVWSFYLHRMLKFIIAHHHYVIIVYFWILILSYGIYRRTHPAYFIK